MEELRMEASKSTPMVHFDPASGILKMEGQSYPENAFQYYAPIQSWIDTFLEESTLPLQLNLNLIYLNTSSSKCIMDLIDRLEDAFQEGKDVKIHWHYDEENDSALELAEEFKEGMTLPFEIIALPEEES